jgi:GTP-binding protein EngB required for normal cell division
MNLTDETADDVLHDYARLKLDLAAIVRTLLYSAEKSKDELSVQDCRRILARLAEDRFNLAIVGQFSRGKSSLMNALLGAEKLPTGILPLTSVITTVTYGETERVLLLREGWSIPQEIRLDQLPEYVTQNENPGNEKKVLLAEVRLPNELLRLGVHFVDTPGVASSIAANTRTTRQFLPEADAAILVTSFESPMTEAETAFLQEVREHVHKVFIVVNKLDLVPAADRGLVMEAVRSTVRTVLSDSDPMVFAVSARQALAAKLSGSSKELSESGLPILEAALSDFLRKDKARESLLRAAARCVRIAQQQETSIRIAQRARRPEEAMLLEERLKVLSAHLIDERDAMICAMRDRLPGEFAAACAEIAVFWNTDVENEVGSQLQAWISRSRSEVSRPLFKDFVQNTLRTQFASWTSRHLKAVDQKFEEITQRETVALEALATLIRALPFTVLEDHGNSEEAGGGLITISLEPAQLAFRELCVPLADFEVPWWYELVPSRLLTHLADRWNQRASELKAAYERAASELLSTAMNDWIDAVNRELGSRIDRITKQTRELLTRDSHLIETADIDELIKRVEAFMKSVLRMGNDASESYSFLTAPPSNDNQQLTALRPCRICLGLEKTLRDFMAHRQYELAVNESDQRNHALRSGFCPVHTWQYEAVASPQGVCAAYSALLNLYAKRWLLLAQDATSIQAMESGVRAILPTQASCAACQLVASTEKTMAREMAKNIRDDQVPSSSVCAFHLRSILMAGPDRKAAHRLLAAEARAFQRLAENMQNHILKHEAVRHHLSTNAEQDAATAGLARLVGRRSIVAPWRIE